MRLCGCFPAVFKANPAVSKKVLALYQLQVSYPMYIHVWNDSYIIYIYIVYIYIYSIYIYYMIYDI